MVLAFAGDSTITSLPDLRRGAASAAALFGFARVLALVRVVTFAVLFLAAAVFLTAVRLTGFLRAAVRFAFAFGSGSGGVMPACAGVTPMRYRVVPHTGHAP